MEVSDNDNVTAFFTCTAFGGDDAVLDITWSGLNVLLESGNLNPDNSITSTLITGVLTLEDRGDVTCTVMFQDGINGSRETASLNIGTRICFTCILNVLKTDIDMLIPN